MGKRKYTHIQALAPAMVEMRAAGMSRREIADELGLTLKSVEGWVTRYNKQQEAMRKGTPAKVRGRPRIRPMTKEEEYLREIARLEMENKLLRDFLQSTGRK